MSSEVPFLAADVERHQELRKNLPFFSKLQAKFTPSSRSSTADFTANIKMAYSVDGFCDELTSCNRIDGVVVCIWEVLLCIWDFIYFIYITILFA